MGDNYISPWAKAARIFEIIIPAYMFGKSWGIADSKTLDLFRAEFPPFIIDHVELLKSLAGATNENLGRFIATSAGAIVGIFIVLLMAIIFHFVMSDRKYIDSLRFTAVTLIPICLLNGTLSHVLKTFLKNFDAVTANPEAIKQAVFMSSWRFFGLYVVFYLIALWFMGRRTGLMGWKRYAVVVTGIGFIVLYVISGWMILPSEWQVLQPKLLQIFIH